MPALRGQHSKRKTRRHTRDLDQVHADVHDTSGRHLALYTETKAAEDLPGLGNYYCVECSKWFESEYNMLAHRRGNPHKRRLRQLRDDPYLQKDAELAVGLSTDNGRRRDANAAADGSMLVDNAEREAVPDGVASAAAALVQT